MTAASSLSETARRAVKVAGTRAPWLIDAYRFAINPKREARVRKDGTDFAREWAFVRDLRAGTATGTTVLFALYRDDVYEAKLAGMLAAGVILDGASAEFALPSRRFRHSARIVTALEQGPLRYGEDLVPDGAWADEELDRTLAPVRPAPDLEAAKRMKLGSYEIGFLVLSSLIRRTEGLIPDLTDPDSWARFRDLTRIAIVNYRRAERLLDQARPDYVVLREPGYVENGPLVDVAVSRGLDVVEIGPAKRDDALLFKRLRADTRRVLPQCVSPEAFRQAARAPWTEASEDALEAEFKKRYGGVWALQRNYSLNATSEVQSRDELVAELGLDPDRKIAVLYSHVLWDATFWGGEDLFASYADWFSETVAAAARNEDVSWIVKTHPANVIRFTHGDVEDQCAELTLIEEMMPRLPDHMRLLLPDSRITSFSLYGGTDYTVTVRGAPGYEMPCFGKPAITAGTGTYQGLGFTVDSATQAEYFDRIAHLADLAPLSDEEILRAKVYTLAMFRDRPWRMRSFRNVFSFADEGWDPLDRNLVPVGTTEADIRANGDLHRFSEWLMGTEDLDYIEDPTVTAEERAAELLAESWTANRYLVTGAAGMIGGAVAGRLAAAGHDVWTIDNLSTGPREAVPEGVTLVEGACQADESIAALGDEPFDAILHFAGQSSGEVSFDDPVYDLRTNTEATLRLAEYALRTGCLRFVYASSMSVYGDVPDVPINEQWCPNPVSFYGVGKLASEHYLRIYERRGLRPTSLRLFNVYGPGQNMANLRQGMVSIYLAQFLRSSQVIVKGSPDRFRDLVFLADVVDLSVSIIDDDRSVGGIFNVGTGVRTSVGELLELIRATTGSGAEVVFEGATPGDQLGIYADVALLEQTIGFTPRTRLADGLAEMVEWAGAASW